MKTDQLNLHFFRSRPREQREVYGGESKRAIPDGQSRSFKVVPVRPYKIHFLLLPVDASHFAWTARREISLLTSGELSGGLGFPPASTLMGIVILIVIARGVLRHPARFCGDFDDPDLRKRKLD